MKRTIMIFPEFENGALIDEIRTRWDPLADKVRPHITLVFPFESAYGTEEIKDFLHRRLGGFQAFPLVLRGLSQSGIWLFLNVAEGKNELTQLHRRLYTNGPAAYKGSRPYAPHLTLGRFESEENCQRAFEKAKALRCGFFTLADKVSVEIIGSQEESIVEYEYLLERRN